MRGRVLAMQVTRQLLDALEFGGMDTTTTVRPASAADIDALVELRERMLVELGSDDGARLASLATSSAEWLARAFSEDRAAGWLAHRDGVVVGGITVILTETLPQYRSLRGRVATILGLFVAPEERGAGLASDLVSGALAHARRWEADVVVLHSAAKALPIYERLGFIPTKEMRFQLSECAAVNDDGECDV